MKDKPTNTAAMKKPGSGGIFLLLAQYKWKLIVLCGLVIFSSGMNLFIPRLVAAALE
jgi:multisubunit Na+/H+ antiporter MnhC subunit